MKTSLSLILLLGGSLTLHAKTLSKRVLAQTKASSPSSNTKVGIVGLKNNYLSDFDWDSGSQFQDDFGNLVTMNAAGTIVSYSD